ncbi:MAG: hypothetical protein KHY62_03490 [Firmicutes bacterium]|nr:hypothetical protein [Bacillota bacterium]
MAGGSTIRSAGNVSMAASRVSGRESLFAPSTRQIRQKRGRKRVENKGFFGSAKRKIHGR